MNVNCGYCEPLVTAAAVNACIAVSLSITSRLKLTVLSLASHTVMRIFSRHAGMTTQQGPITSTGFHRWRKLARDIPLWFTETLDAPVPVHSEGTDNHGHSGHVSYP